MDGFVAGEFGADKVGVGAHGALGAGADAAGGHKEHEGLHVHADVEGDGGAEGVFHADEGDVGRVEEFEVAQVGAHAAFGVVARDAHFGVHGDGAVDLAFAVVAVEFAGVGHVGVGGDAVHDVVDELVAEPVADFSGSDEDAPGLDVAVGGGLLGEREDLVEDILVHGFVEVAADGSAGEDGFVEGHNVGGSLGHGLLRIVLEG